MSTRGIVPRGGGELLVSWKILCKVSISMSTPLVSVSDVRIEQIV